jgi:putative ABC transport system substrate-binding protein
MKRREFISFLGGTAATWPLAVRAQQPAMPVVGVLSASPGWGADRDRAFQQGLADAGFTPGRNVAMEYRWAEGHNDQFPAMAADLVRRRITVIAAIGGNASALAAKAATGTIPIVFAMGADPVEFGLVASLNRPGANATGVTNLNVELGPKRLELLHEVVPTAATIALLVNPTNPTAEFMLKQMQTAARTLGLMLPVVHASTDRDFDAAFATVVKLRADALVIGADAFFNSRREHLAALTVRHAVPAIYQFREFAAAGGLMSYGGDFTDMFRQAGVYTGRVLKGEKPADLPVQQSTKVELFINLKMAKALGVTIPLPLVGRADEVIE